MLRAAEIPSPVLEHRFAPPRRWRFDLAWPDRLIALEIEGGVWVGGRHVRPKGYESDCEKYTEAAVRGWTVLRVLPEWLEDRRALEYVERAFRARRPDKAAGFSSCEPRNGATKGRRAQYRCPAPSPA